MQTKSKKRLTLKQTKFIAAYLANGGNGTRAAETAEYGCKNGKKPSETYLGVAANRLIRNDKIKTKIKKVTNKIIKKAEITIEYIQSEHLRLKKLCEKQRDFSNATANLAWAGRTVGAYTENVVTTDLTRQSELDEKARCEAAELARLRLGEKYGVKVG